MLPCGLHTCSCALCFEENPARTVPFCLLPGSMESPPEGRLPKQMMPSLLCLLFYDAFSDHACVFLCVSMHLEAELLTKEEIPTQCGMATKEWMATQYNQASDTCMANTLNMHCRRTQPSLSISGTGSLRETTRLQGQTTIPLKSLRCTSQDMRSEKHYTSPKLRIPIPYYTLYNTISPSYTSLPEVMTVLVLQTSLILVVEFHAVCRCTICDTQPDSEARIPGITMTVRVDILTKAVTSNPQTAQPKFPNQLCDLRPELIEHATNVHLIPPLTINTDTRKQTPEIQTNPFHPPSLTHPLLPRKHTPHLTSETPPLSVP